MQDVQGVLRGRCNRCGDCSAYRRPPGNGVLCGACHHPPVAHQNLSQAQYPLPTVSGRGGPPVQPQLGLAPQRAPYSSSVMMPPPAASTTYPSSGYGQYPTVQAPRTSLPTCKNSGCSKPVHLDPTYGPFEYCSPMCRDAELLQRERDKLKKDIESMTSSQSPQTSSASGGSYPSLHSATPPVPSRTSSQPQRSDHLARVNVEKAFGKDIGIIVRRSLDFSPSADKAAFLITGVVTTSPAFPYFKDGKLKLLGLITRVGATDVKDIDETFEDFTRRMDNVELHLDMHKALPQLHVVPPSDKRKEATHIICLKYDSTEQDIGIGFQKSSQGIMVEKVKRELVPDLSGIRAKDLILVNGSNPVDADTFLASLSQSQMSGIVEVLYIKRM